MALEKELQQYMSKCMDILECMVLCYGFIIHQEASKSVVLDGSQFVARPNHLQEHIVDTRDL